jgi:YhcH/YjgK/YiaL family protein
MIFDVLDNAARYRDLHKGFKQAFDFLLRPDIRDLATGEYELDGRRVYAVVAKEEGRRKEEALLEAHVKYIDIQLVLEGTDTMGWAPRISCKHQNAAYDEEEDIQYFTDPPEVWFPTEVGYFAMFFPEDAHMPLISPTEIHKVVVKIAVDQD